MSPPSHMIKKWIHCQAHSPAAAPMVEEELWSFTEVNLQIWQYE